MNSYKDIPLWENTRRLKILKKFRNDVVSYFKNNRPCSDYDWATSQPRKEQDGRTRQQLNLKVFEVHWIIKAAGITPAMTEIPAPAVGGHMLQINTILNLFDLDINTRPRAVDFIDMALGVYQSDQTAARRRTINPFWWLKRGFLWFVRIPFVLLGEMGLDAARIEGNALGKFFKVIISLLIPASALLTILYYMGWLAAAKELLRIE